MTDGNQLIEKLLSHAKAHLELSDYDLPCKRSLLRYILRVEDNTPAPVEQIMDGQSLKKELISYALEKGLTYGDSTSGFASFVMSLLSPLPSAVNKKFRTMREQLGAASACEYLYSLSVGDWGIDGLSLDKKTRLYSQDGPVEILVANTLSAEDGSPVEPRIEHCDCNDVVRSVSISLDGEECVLQYVSSLSRDEECFIYSKNKAFLPPFDTKINAMLDFIEYIPDYSITATNNPLFIAKNQPAFVAGRFTPTAFTVKPDFSLESKAYPDVEISLFHQINSGVRLQSFNRNTLERLSTEILTAWHNYQDQNIGLTGVQGDGAGQNFASVCVRYTKDGRYCVDIALTCKKSVPDGFGKAFSNFAGDLGPEALFGMVILTEKFNDVLKMISAVLTKKIPLDNSLFTERAPLYGFEEFLNGIIADLGYFKDEQKAQNQLKTAMTAAIKRAIKDKSPFGFDDDGTRSFKIFLSTVDVK